jgi:hypothetical protein
MDVLVEAVDEVHHADGLRREVRVAFASHQRFIK